MKIKAMFVGNSSSSSFILRADCLTAVQREMVLYYDDFAHIFNQYLPEGEKFEYLGSAWSVSEDRGLITLDTLMDNFDMERFLDQIGVPSVAYVSKEKYG